MIKEFHVEMHRGGKVKVFKVASKDGSNSFSLEDGSDAWVEGPRFSRRVNGPVFRSIGHVVGVVRDDD